jgi:hypothetical protein
MSRPYFILISGNTASGVEVRLELKSLFLKGENLKEFRKIMKRICRLKRTLCRLNEDFNAGRLHYDIYFDRKSVFEKAIQEELCKKTIVHARAFEHLMWYGGLSCRTVLHPGK